MELLANLSAECFKSLAHPVRIKILKLLGQGELCVCQLIDEIAIEQSNLSQHLSILKKQGLVSARKDGTKIFYTVLYPSIFDVINIVEKILVEQANKNQNLLKNIKRG